MASRLLHIRSSVVGKVPTAANLAYGQIAVNYASGSETLYFKNASDAIVKIPAIALTDDILKTSSVSVTPTADTVPKRGASGSLQSSTTVRASGTGNDLINRDFFDSVVKGESTEAAYVTLNQALKQLVAVSTISTTTFEITTANNTLYRFTGTSAGVITIAASSVIGDRFTIINQTNFDITVNAGSGITINDAFGGGISPAGKGAAVTYVCVGSNVWDAIGVTV